MRVRGDLRLRLEEPHRRVRSALAPRSRFPPSHVILLLTRSLSFRLLRRPERHCRERVRHLLPSVSADYVHVRNKHLRVHEHTHQFHQACAGGTARRAVEERAIGRLLSEDIPVHCVSLGFPELLVRAQRQCATRGRVGRCRGVAGTHCDHKHDRFDHRMEGFEGMGRSWSWRCQHDQDGHLVQRTRAGSYCSGRHHRVGTY